MEVINLLFEELRVFQKLEVYEWFCIRGGIIDPYTTSYSLFCVMVSCFAGCIMTRSARRKAGKLAWSAIWGDPLDQGVGFLAGNPAGSFGVHTSKTANIPRLLTILDDNINAPNDGTFSKTMINYMADAQ